VEKSWNNQSLFGGKCEWKTKALAERMELSDFSWEMSGTSGRNCQVTFIRKWWMH
jgi:hypothetical protein